MSIDTESEAALNIERIEEPPDVVTESQIVQRSPSDVINTADDLNFVSATANERSSLTVETQPATGG